MRGRSAADAACVKAKTALAISAADKRLMKNPHALTSRIALTEPRKNEVVPKYGRKVGVVWQMGHIGASPMRFRLGRDPPDLGCSLFHVMSALPPKADLCSALNVCFGPKANLSDLLFCK